jgi:glutathione peroxidase
MKVFRLAVAAAVVVAIAAGGTAEDKQVTGPLDFKMKRIDGQELDLSRFKGKVVLIVNVASECGYTPQYKGLQELYEKFGKDGLVVVGVPSNDFGKQEPGTDEEIRRFCATNYKVTFPMTTKVVVKGADKVPLYKFLTAKETNPNHAGEVGWNFEKFLINRKGEVVGRFKSAVDPASDEFVRAVKTELDRK